MRILFIGDIVGKPGRRAVEGLLGGIVRDRGITFTIANGENAAGGMGLTAAIAEEIFRKGVQVLTSGNHIWAKKEIFPYLREEPRLLRPANYPPHVPGRGSGVFELGNGVKVGVLNLEGRVFMKTLDCPFRTAQQEIEALRRETPVIVVDFHAEATSEKVALGRFLRGQVSAVLGTHTHVQTCDEKVLEGGTAYITDVGMTGPVESVIGVREELAFERFLTQVPLKYDVASGHVELRAVVIDVDPLTGQCQSIERLQMPLLEWGRSLSL
jgi:metallophosphoesterase (TIGR00282 family)